MLFCITNMYDKRDKFFIEETSKKRCLKTADYMFQMIHGSPWTCIRHENGVIHLTNEKKRIEKFYIIKKGKDVKD